jgi:environmental stress-induced protein Ves
VAARVKILPRAGYRRMPWKNGGGVTEEIAREPAEGEFAWRLSMARIDAPGPFSDFSGYSRVMVLLEGAGLTLQAPGEQDRILRRAGDWTRFDGSLAIHCSLQAGSCTDLNLMVRKDLRFEAGVETVTGPLPLRPEGHRLIVVALDDLSIQGDGQSLSLAALGTVLLEGGEQATLASGSAGAGFRRAFIARIAAG